MISIQAVLLLLFPKSIRNNQKPTKIVPKQNCTEKISTSTPKYPQCDWTIGLHLQNKRATITTMTSNFLFLPGQEEHSIF